MLNDILKYLPYKSSFRFVDNIRNIDEDGVTGDYALRKDSFFYEDHFVGNPVTPGAIIIEIMAQIGLVVLGIYLIKQQNHSAVSDKNFYPLFTSANVEFYKILYPNEKVLVRSKKEYFRFGKLKCFVAMYNESNELIADGYISGIIKESN